MNIKQFSKNVGKWFKLRPLVERRTSDGQPLSAIDDYWVIEGVNGNSVELKNIRTGHVKTLGFDNIREYRSPDFLFLRCQIIMQGINIIIEPIVTRS